MRRLGKDRGSWFTLAILIVLWALYHFRVLFLEHAFVLQDSSRFFHPLWKWGAGVWGQGWIPLWNPDAGFGTPYLADPQMAAWYPPVRALYWLFSPTTAFNLSIVLHHLWVLLGFWVFARGRSFSPWVALGGCLVFGFCFNTVSLSWATPMLLAFSWIPWIFHWAYGLREGRSNAFFFLSLVLALQMASGYPLFSYMTLVVLGLDWFFNVLSKGWKGSGLSMLGWGTAAVLLALSYNAAWLLPFNEFIPHSNLEGRMGLSGSLNWNDLLTWLNPFHKGHPLHSNPGTPFSVTVYFAGLPTLAVVFWGAWKRKLKGTSVLLFLLLLVLSLGETALVGEWLKTFLPGYGLVVRSGYWIPFVVWAAARLFMEAGENMSSMETSKSNASAVTWPAIAGAVYFLALIAGVPWELPSLWISFLLLLCAGISKTLSWDRRGALLALSLIFSLGPVVRSVNFTMERSYYDKPPEVLERLTAPGRIYNTPSLEDHFRGVSGNGAADAYGKLKEAMVSNWPLGFGREEAGYSNALFVKSFLRWYYAPALGGGSKEILDYLNSRYVVGWLPTFNGRSEAWAGTVPLWDNPSAGPKWYSARKAISQGEWELDLFRMKKDLDLPEVCLAREASLLGDYGKRRIFTENLSPNLMILTAAGKGRALLMSSETAYPGWRARVGNEWRQVEEVNHGFRGLVLEEGEEKAVMVYLPNSFKIGFFLSLLACALWAGMILWMKWGPARA